MPRLTRAQQKIFAGQATNNGVFGSLQSNDPVTSSDPATIQSRTAFLNGWNDATYSAEQLPPLEEFQAIQYIVTRQLAYMLQEGIPEWDVNTTYYKGSIVKVVSGSEYTLFESLIDNNTGNLTSDTTRWKVCGVSEDFNTGMHYWRADVTYGLGDWVRGVDAGGNPDIFQSLQADNKGNSVTDITYWSALGIGKNGFPLLSHLFYDHELNEANWLRADTWSWQSGSIYQSAYQALVNAQSTGTQASETIGSYTIQFTRATNGWKIVSEANAGTVEDIYQESGVAWYYILDTANQRFKLPRENPAREELVETVPVVGNGTALGLLADTGVGGTLRYLFQDNLPKFGFSQVGSNVPVGTAATSWNTNNSFFNKAVGVTTNENNSGIIAKFSGETTKSVFKGHKYLYFYVGNVIRNQTEVDVGEITEALNKKWDSSNMQVVDALPENPQTGIFYFVK